MIDTEKLDKKIRCYHTAPSSSEWLVISEEVVNNEPFIDSVLLNQTHYCIIPFGSKQIIQTSLDESGLGKRKKVWIFFHGVPEEEVSEWYSVQHWLQMQDKTMNQKLQLSFQAQRYKLHRNTTLQKAWQKSHV